MNFMIVSRDFDQGSEATMYAIEHPCVALSSGFVLSVPDCDPPKWRVFELIPATTV